MKIDKVNCMRFNEIFLSYDQQAIKYQSTRKKTTSKYNWFIQNAHLEYIVSALSLKIYVYILDILKEWNKRQTNTDKFYLKLLTIKFLNYISSSKSIPRFVNETNFIYYIGLIREHRRIAN